MVDEGKGDLGPKVFFVWGSTCTLCLLFAYLCVPETKGLSLEQVDRMMEESTPRTSARWAPHSTYAQEAGTADRKDGAAVVAEHGQGTRHGVGSEHDEKMTSEGVATAGERV
jgi:Sugar (and other) transporter